MLNHVLSIGISLLIGVSTASASDHKRSRKNFDPTEFLDEKSKFAKEKVTTSQMNKKNITHIDLSKISNDVKKDKIFTFSNLSDIQNLRLVCKEFKDSTQNLFTILSQQAAITQIYNLYNDANNLNNNDDELPSYSLLN